MKPGFNPIKLTSLGFFKNPQFISTVGRGACGYGMMFVSGDL